MKSSEIFVVFAISNIFVVAYVLYQEKKRESWQQCIYQPSKNFTRGKKVETVALCIYARCVGIMCRNGGYVMRTAFRRVYHAYCLGCL